MKKLLTIYNYLQLVFAIGIVIVGAYLFVFAQNKLTGKSLLVAGLVGHLYFFLKYYFYEMKLNRKQ